MNQKIFKHIVITLFLTAILSLNIGGVLVYNLYQKAYDANAEVITTYQTIRAANQALLSINEAALDVSAFLITNNSETIKSLPQMIISAQLNTETLKQLIADDETELRIFNKLKPLIDKKIEFLQQIVSIHLSGNKAAALKLASDKERLMLTKDINELIIDIKKLEIGQLDQAMPTYQLMKNNAARFFILVGIINIIWFLLAYIFMRVYLH